MSLNYPGIFLNGKPVRLLCFREHFQLLIDHCQIIKSLRVLFNFETFTAIVKCFLVTPQLHENK